MLQWPYGPLKASLVRLSGDRAVGPAGDLGSTTDALADPVVGADRQLVLAPQRSPGIDDGSVAQRLRLERDPDPEGGPGAGVQRHCNQAGAAPAAELENQPGGLAALGVEEEVLHLTGL